MVDGMYVQGMASDSFDYDNETPTSHFSEVDSSDEELMNEHKAFMEHVAGDFEMICAWCGEEISEVAVPWNDDGDYMHPECYEDAWATPSTYYDDLAWGKQDRPEDRE